MDRASRRAVKSALEEFAERTGKTVEDGIDRIARATGKVLVTKVQPFGYKKGAKFIENIGKQVDQVAFAVNIGAYPATSDIRSAHYAARAAENPQGKIRLRSFKSVKGKKWLDLISTGDKEAYKRKQQAKAGQAKGAWIAASNDVGKEKLSGVAAWVQRHAASGYGSAKKSGEGLKYKVSLENRTPYLPRIQKNSDVKAALTMGLRNGLKSIVHAINGEIKKANKLLSQ
jgi:hypothetical protein